MDINLEPTVLQWARERARLSPEELAAKMQVKVDRIVTWERSGKLTISLAERLAEKTHTPFGYLFFPQPFTEADILPIKDFRTPLTQEIQKPSIDLLEVVNAAILRQDWYRDYVLSTGGAPVPLVGSIRLSQDPVEVADYVQEMVGWGANISTRSMSWEVALSRHIDTVEAAGILVMRSSIVGNNTHRKLDVNEFRGFSLSERYAPLIFINLQDSIAAQMFTLAHALVHIGLDESGVSDVNPTDTPDAGVERFCNAVAAEILVPMEELQKLRARNEAAIDIVDIAVRFFKVSSLVILRRLYEAGALTEEDYHRRYINELGQFKQKATKRGGGDYYANLRARLGDQFVSAVVTRTLEGGTTYREAFQLLGVKKATTIHKLAAAMGVMYA